MTVAIPEAAEAVGGGSTAALQPSAVFKPGAGRPVRRGRPYTRPPGGNPGGNREYRGGRYYRYYSQPERPVRRTSGPRPDRMSGGGGILPSSEGHGTYHRVVIAEFIVCVILVGASPFLVPRKSSSKPPAEEAADALASASLAGPLVRLTALCIVFFGLALLSTGRKTGKIAAAFGGLVTLGVLLNATDMFAAIHQAFGAGKKPASSGSSSAGGTGATGGTGGTGATGGTGGTGGSSAWSKVIDNGKGYVEWVFNFWKSLI